MPKLRSGRDALEGAAAALHGERPAMEGAVGCCVLGVEKGREKRAVDHFGSI